VSGANLVQSLMAAGLLGFFFLCTLYLRLVLHMGPLQIGLAFMPVAISIGALSLGLSARLTTRFGARAVLLPGLALVTAGLLVAMRAPERSDYLFEVLPAMLLIGVGAGLSFPSLMTLGMSDSTADDSGLASGLLNTTVQVAGAVGLAVLATLAAARTDSLLVAGESTASALTGGYRLVYGIAAALAASALVVAATVLRPEASEARDRRDSPARGQQAGDDADRSSAA
jgi:MFS family permease